MVFWSRGMVVVSMVGSMVLGLWLVSWTEQARKENSTEFYKYQSLRQSKAENEQVKFAAVLKKAIGTDKNPAASLSPGEK